MTTAQLAAPEIDRLVLSLNSAVGARHGAHLGALAGDLGLDGLGMLPGLGDFLAAGVLCDRIAASRMRYRHPDEITGWLGDLVAKGLAERRDGVYAPTERSTPLLGALAEAVTDVASSAWGGHPELVGTIGAAASRVAAAVPSDHIVAATHRDIPEPDDPSGRLFRRLSTLRYIRQHDHVEAWRRRHLSAEEMTVMTPLWHDQRVDLTHPGLAALVAKGYAETGPSRLSDKGRRVRDAIEDDTNTWAQQSFDVLDPPAAAGFVDSLRRLPSAAP
ncbi:MAG: helix-turn-helix domain-containing protein [Acidimicrobiia bacterium]